MTKYFSLIRGFSNTPTAYLACLIGMLIFISAGYSEPQTAYAETLTSNRQEAAKNPNNQNERQALKKHILVITSQPYVTEWFIELNNSLRKRLFSFLSSESKLSYEYIGSESLTDPEYNTALVGLLKKKYSRIALDMVIAIMPTGSQFLLNHSEDIFPEIPVIFVLPSKEQIPIISGRPRTGLVKSASNAIPETIDRIHALLPETEHLAVISGSGADDLNYKKMAEEALKNKAWPKTVEYLTGIPAAELAVKLERLPARSAVLVLTFLQDQKGAPLSTTQVMNTVSSRTTAPMFGFYDTILGQGIVGGKLTSAETYGNAIAETAEKLFKGGPASPLAVSVAEARDIYDWRQIEKWRIQKDLLPAGSEIRYRKISFWEEHLTTVILVGAVIFMQTFLIVAMIFNLIRRRRAEETLKKYGEHLEELVKERTDKLEQANQDLLLEIEERTKTEKALMKSETMYRDLVESANSIILRWTSKGTITFSNTFAQQFFGFDKEELIGRNIIGTIVPEIETSGRDLSLLVGDIVKNPAAYEQNVNVNENIRKDGQRVWVAWTNKPLMDDRGHLAEILSIGNDITKLVEVERDLRETLVKLDHAKERAEAADRLKSAFLATMSHELRTPLNSIIGFTGILIQRLVGPLNEEQDKQLNMVYNSAKHLLALINDILDISKIEAGQLTVVRETFDLRSSIEKVIQSSRPLIDKKGLNLSAVIAPEIGPITSDRRRIEQILLNLISNAIKFTEHGFVHIECNAVENEIIIDVKDSGIGIKQEDMGILFNAFQQIESGITRKYEGTGLGLSICKKLAHLLGGEILVVSQWGMGSTFSLVLPK